MHAIYIKLMPKPAIENFHKGTECEAIYSEDGKYHPCVIDKIEEGKYFITFNKSKAKETVSIYHLREARKNNLTG